MTKSIVLLASREVAADDSDAMQVRIVLLLIQLLKEANLGMQEVSLATMCRKLANLPEGAPLGGRGPGRGQQTDH